MDVGKEHRKQLSDISGADGGPFSMQKDTEMEYGEVRARTLERCLGAHPVDFAGWTPPEYWDADDIALEVGSS